MAGTVKPLADYSHVTALIQRGKLMASDAKRRARRPTMNDVARQAGVALSTVSRVVNSDPTVGEEFVARVRTAVEELGYRPDEQAQLLRRGVSRTIGVAVRELSGPNAVLMAFERAARREGLVVLAASTNEDEDQEREIVMLMARRSFDGVVLEPIGDEHNWVAPEVAAGLAVVAIDRPIVGADADTVLSDNAGGIRMAYSHLRGHGHRHIAYIGDDERIFTGHARAAAFRECLAEDGRPAQGLVHAGDVEQTRISEALRRVLGRHEPVTAVIAGNADTTIMILTHLFATTPAAQRPALIGFDDFPLAGLLDPPVTVIAQDTAAIGLAALRLLTARLADPKRPIETVTIPVSLVARGSGELGAGSAADAGA